MKLYHASTQCIEKPDVLHSRDKLDFGRGFYMTSIKEQAIRYSERFTRRGKDAFINEYELDEETPGFTIKTFESYDEEWLDYVTLCRRGDITIPKSSFCQSSKDIIYGGKQDSTSSARVLLTSIVVVTSILLMN